MKKFENVYQDAALMRKVLLGEADEVEQKDLEKRLAECPDLRNVYEQLQSGETLKVAFGEYQKYSSKKAYQSFLQSIGQMESKGRKSRSRLVPPWSSPPKASTRAEYCSGSSVCNVPGKLRRRTMISVSMHPLLL